MRTPHKRPGLDYVAVFLCCSATKRGVGGLTETEVRDPRCHQRTSEFSQFLMAEYRSQTCETYGSDHTAHTLPTEPCLQWPLAAFRADGAPPMQAKGINKLSGPGFVLPT